MIPGLSAREVSDALKEFIVTGFETEIARFFKADREEDYRVAWEAFSLSSRD